MENTYDYQPQKQRTTLLTVLCVLSFIGGGLIILSNFFVLSLWNKIPEIIATNPFAEQFGMNEMIESTFSADKKPMYITMLILNIVSICGVSMIWKLKDLGVHFYIAAQICLLIAPMIWIQPFSFPFFDFIITALFIFLYITELRKIKKTVFIEDDFSDNTPE